MRYDEYLAKGWPIASGPVEGACKNLIKDRMERSGMRWTEQMAEAIVQLRAIYLSGDFDRYWSFHIQKDQQRLHPGNWTVVLNRSSMKFGQYPADSAKDRSKFTFQLLATNLATHRPSPAARSAEAPVET